MTVLQKSEFNEDHSSSQGHATQAAQDSSQPLAEPSAEIVLMFGRGFEYFSMFWTQFRSPKRKIFQISMLTGIIFL